MSIQRMRASTHENFTLLQKRRLEALVDTGIMDPATGSVDTSRVFNMDEAPNPMDGTLRGNNVEGVYGDFTIFIFVFKKLFVAGRMVPFSFKSYY